MTRLRAFLMSLLLLLPAAAAIAQQPAGGLDTSAISQALGRPGQTQGPVYRVGFPRTDLAVTVHGIPIKPGLALGSWAAFMRAGTQAVVHGDLVLAQAEINPVISKLQAGGIQITALHNHLIEETPHVMYLHYWGQGAEGALAATVRAALATTATPLGAPAAAAPPAAPSPADAAWIDAIQKGMGKTGAVNGGVLGISFPRPETITMMGVELPPQMGMATSLSFQDGGNGKVVATGDFVMTDAEVNPVAKALRDHGIDIAALHNHMLHGSPTLYFMHFWAEGSASDVAAGLKAAVDLLAR